MLAFGVFATEALADSTPSGTIAGGATAPASISGATGATGVTGAAGTTSQSAPLTAGLAPIVLPKGQSADYVYSGPVYIETAAGTVVPYIPQTTAADVSGGTIAGTATAGLPHLLVPGSTAEIVHGIAAAPQDAPAVVQRVIWAANRIIGRPYVYGGGHRSFVSNGYDCSGTVSYALHGGALLHAPLDSSQFAGWGAGGQGQWMTILTNPAHAYLDVAGLRLDTSTADDPSNEQGPRWRPLRPANPGYTLRHPNGL